MKRGLQIFLGLASLVPLIVSLTGLVFGTGRFLPADLVTPTFDTHYRYIVGYYLSLRLLAWRVIPNIERHTVPLRIISFSIFMGGVGRVVSMLEVGLPPTLPLGFTAFELCFPLVLLWQARLTKIADEIYLSKVQ